MDKIFCLSPIDGRYHSKTNILQSYLSEFGLIRYRIIVEIEWLKYLSTIDEIKEIKPFTVKEIEFLNSIIKKFNEKEALIIKKIENKINHDVKAVEYYIREKILQNKNLSYVSEFIHFGCTSEDINNLSYGLILKNVTNDILIPKITNLHNNIVELSINFSNQAMISRTHGQPASPTTVGKELANFSYRIRRQLDQLKKIHYLGKMNGAVGNFNAHVIAYPNINWIEISKKFIVSLGLKNNPLTTQIEPHDYIVEYCQCLMRTNIILIDFCRDIWGYISLNYFKQKIITQEIGSSTMPHKINPIDFENAEGNLGIANSYLGYLSSKLPISRWQRDLTDSTTLRNIGVAIAHGFVSYQAILIGISKLELNIEPILNDLKINFEIVSEAIQTIMRRHKISNPYEKLKGITRGKNFSKEDLIKFIDTLNLPHKIKDQLKSINPNNYIGFAQKLTNLSKKI